MEEIQKDMKELRKLKFDQRVKRIEQIMEGAKSETVSPSSKYGIVDIDTLSAKQAYALIDTDFGIDFYCYLFFLKEVRLTVKLFRLYYSVK